MMTAECILLKRPVLRITEDESNVLVPWMNSIKNFLKFFPEILVSRNFLMVIHLRAANEFFHAIIHGSHYAAGDSRSKTSNF